MNASLSDALGMALAAQAEQAAAQAAAMSNLSSTLAAVLGGLSQLQAGLSSLAARMDTVEANAALLDSLVVSPPMPPRAHCARRTSSPSRSPLPPR